jgi:cytochrome c553
MPFATVTKSIAAEAASYFESIETMNMMNPIPHAVSTIRTVPDAKPKSRRMATTIVAIACLLITHAGNSMATRDIDLRERLAACATCHGDRGQGAKGAEYYPHLAGKPAGYLLAQMQGFRDGRRHYPQMIYLMQFMDDAYLGEIAAWYAAQPAHAQRAEQTAAPLDATSEARARQLVFEGDPSIGLPACARCHGERLSGLEPGVPALLSLPPDYIIAQIGGWMTGARKSIAPDCMAEISHKLTPVDVRIVANWLSRQPTDSDTHPALANARALPMACGDLPHAPDNEAAHGMKDAQR